jgi:hypothetical protein
MHSSGTLGSLEKRKVCVFLILIAVALLCVGVVVYTLFYTQPRTNPMIEEHGNSMLQHLSPGSPEITSVHS